MKHFISYLNNGKIIKTGICFDNDFDNQGENVMEVIADDSLQYVSNGFVVYLPEKPNGEYQFNYDTKEWEPDEQVQSSFVLNKRQVLLSESDWTQLPDVPLATKEAWATYRQALRDITSQEGYPFGVIWPTKPE